MEKDDEAAIDKSFSAYLDVHLRKLRPGLPTERTAPPPNEVRSNMLPTDHHANPESAEAALVWRRTYIVQVEPDHDAENPCEMNEDWVVWSFNCRHTNYGDEERLGLVIHNGLIIEMEADTRKAIDSGRLVLLRDDGHSWFVADEGQRIGGALEVPDDYTDENREAGVASFLDEYNQWRRGEVYTISVASKSCECCGHEMDRAYLGNVYGSCLDEAAREFIIKTLDLPADAEFDVAFDYR